MTRIIRGNILPSEIEISESELSARLSLPPSAFPSDLREVEKDLLSVADVKFLAARIGVLENKYDKVILENGLTVNSNSLSKYLLCSDEVILFVLTLGAEVDRLIMKKRCISVCRGFIYDAAASAIAEGACDAAQARLTEGIGAMGRFSPGYSDCPLTTQRDIFTALSADKYIGVKLLDSNLMSPMKSVSAFIALLADKEKK